MKKLQKQSLKYYLFHDDQEVREQILWLRDALCIQLLFLQLQGQRWNHISFASSAVPGV
jgi:hypothetical protein